MKEGIRAGFLRVPQELIWRRPEMRKPYAHDRVIGDLAGESLAGNDSLEATSTISNGRFMGSEFIGESSIPFAAYGSSIMFD